MSFTDPITVADPSTGTKATAALLNTWRADMEFSYKTKAGCRARTNTATVLGAGTMIPFELEDFDNNSCHDLVTNNSRITIPASWGGMWWFGFNCHTNNQTTYQVCKNGVTTGSGVLLTVGPVQAAAKEQAQVGFGFARLVAGDYIELRGITGTIVTTINPTFWAQWRAP